MSAEGRKAMVDTMPDDDKEQSFLSRWSRRKLEIVIEEQEIDHRLPVESAVYQPGAPGDARAEAGGSADDAGEAGDNALSAEELEMQANLAAAEAVDLESLDYESDFQLFLKKGVPEALKNAAMQKLWRSNPVLSVLDGLNDYDADYGDPKLNVYKSVWNVGRGFLTEAEMNHNPVDRAKAILQKLIEDKHDELPETAVEGEAGQEVIESQNLPGVEMTEGPELPLEDTNDQADEPRRVSIRSRLFEHAAKDDSSSS